MANDDRLITTTEQLESIYEERVPTSLLKELDHISDDYRAVIEAAPFVVLATVGPEGLDCSPRGDLPGIAETMRINGRAVLDTDANGEMLERITAGGIDAATYDAAYPERLRQTIY
ncbi:MAG: pyridoxamine 5'-phosphate oxidase family protein [Ilumatobacteraceae bacterium]